MRPEPRDLPDAERFRRRDLGEEGRAGTLNPAAIDPRPNLTPSTRSAEEPENGNRACGLSTEH